VAAVGGTVSTNDLANEPALADPDWARIERLRAFAGHPLIHEGRLLGVVAMWSRERIHEEVLEALRVMARHAATAIAGAQLIGDVREQSEKSQAATRKLEALVEASRSGVVLFDSDGSVAYVNGPFRKHFNLTSRPLVGLQRADLEALLSPLVSQGPKGDLLSHVADDLELRLALPGGAERVLRRYTSPVRGPSGQLGWVAVFDDVTEARQVESMKSEFISTVSHELRTPLTSMKGALALVLDSLDLDAPLDEDTVELLRVSRRNAERLIRLVNDILDISKMEAGKLDLRPKPSPVGKLCAEAVSGVDGFARKVRVAIRTDLEGAPQMCQADADRVVQVLTNLLSNALKFSPAGSEVLLSARPSPRGVLFKVQDRGPGIPADFREKLFTKFAQADRARREQEGTGLGLAICRALVQGHGGEIWAEGEPGQGATLCFTLPLA
jgi:PAS domain S-box-containing protein